MVCCVQGPACPVARDAWKTLPSEHSVPFTKESNDLLVFVIDKLLSIANKPHPNSRQVSSDLDSIKLARFYLIFYEKKLKVIAIQFL